MNPDPRAGGVAYPPFMLIKLFRIENVPNGTKATLVFPRGVERLTASDRVVVSKKLVGRRLKRGTVLKIFLKKRGWRSCVLKDMILTVYPVERLVSKKC
jgi:hypothetical protein